MNEAIEYALENLEQTRDIHDVILAMKEKVLRGFDAAVKEAIPDWYGRDWGCLENDHLYGGYIYI